MPYSIGNTQVFPSKYILAYHTIRVIPASYNKYNSDNIYSEKHI